MNSLQEEDDEFYESPEIIKETKPIIKIMSLQEIIAEQMMQFFDLPREKYANLDITTSDVVSLFLEEKPEEYMFTYMKTMHKLIDDGQYPPEMRYQKKYSLPPEIPLMFYQDYFRNMNEIKF